MKENTTVYSIENCQEKREELSLFTQQLRCNSQYLMMRVFVIRTILINTAKSRKPRKCLTSSKVLGIK